jgi:hypothetical protein
MVIVYNSNGLESKVLKLSPFLNAFEMRTISMLSRPNLVIDVFLKDHTLFHLTHCSSNVKGTNGFLNLCFLAYIHTMFSHK